MVVVTRRIFLQVEIAIQVYGRPCSFPDLAKSATTWTLREATGKLPKQQPGMRRRCKQQLKLIARLSEERYNMDLERSHWEAAQAATRNELEVQTAAKVERVQISLQDQAESAQIALQAELEHLNGEWAESMEEVRRTYTAERQTKEAQWAVCKAGLEARLEKVLDEARWNSVKVKSEADTKSVEQLESVHKKWSQAEAAAQQKELQSRLKLSQEESEARLKALQEESDRRYSTSMKEADARYRQLESDLDARSTSISATLSGINRWG
eukprot:gene16829-23109_t